MRKMSCLVGVGILFVVITTMGCSGKPSPVAPLTVPTLPLEKTQLPESTGQPEIAATPTELPKPTTTSSPTAFPLPTEDQYVISAQNSSQLAFLAGFGGPPAGKISGADWSLDGIWLHLSGLNGDAIYHAEDLELLRAFSKPDHFAFLRNGDEYVLLLGKTVSIFETASGNLIAETQIPGLTGTKFLVSPTGRYLTALTLSNQLTTWDLKSSSLLSVMELGNHFEFDLEVIVNGFFNSDGSQLFVTTSTGGVYQIDLETDQVERLYPAAFIPDPTIVSNTPAECFSPGANGHHLVMLCAQYTPSDDGSRIASTYYTVKWLDLNHGDQRLTSFETRSALSDPSLSPDGKTLYLQGIGEFKLLKLTSDDIEITTAPVCLAHSIDPFSIGPSSTRKVAVINSYERGEFFLCDVESGVKEAAVNFEPLSSVAIGIVGGDYLAAIGRCNGEIELWDPRNRRLITSFEAHDGCVSDLQFNREGEYLASGGEDGLVALWDIGSPGGEPVYTYSHPSAVLDLVLSHNGLQLASISRTQVQLQDVPSGAQLFSKNLEAGKNVSLGRTNWIVVTDGSWINWYDQQQLYTSHFLDIGNLLVNPGANFVSALSYSNDWIGFFNLESGSEIYSFDLETIPLQSIALNLDGCLLIGIGEYDQIQFWSLDPFSAVGMIETGIDRDDRVIAASLSPDGRLVLLGTQDGSVQVWGLEGSLEAAPGPTTTREYCDRLSRPAATATGVPTATKTPTIQPPTSTPVTFTRNLFLAQPNLQGTDVQAVQQRLLALGYDQVGVPDGVFGALTDQAVRQFQEDSGLLVDGVVGPATWELLFAAE